MAMFGFKKRPEEYGVPSPLSGGAMGGGVPTDMGVGGHTSTVDQFMSQAPMQIEDAPVSQPRKKGLFSGFSEPGGLGEKLIRLGAILQAPTESAEPLRNIYQQDQNAAAERAAALRIQQESQARQSQYDYELAHPKPINNDTVNDYNFIAQTLGVDAAKNYLKNVGDPVVSIPLGNGDTYVGPRSGYGSTGGGGGQASGGASARPAIGTVIADPRLRGGAAPQAPAPFQIR